MGGVRRQKLHAVHYGDRHERTSGTSGQGTPGRPIFANFSSYNSIKTRSFRIASEYLYLCLLAVRVPIRGERMMDPVLLASLVKEHNWLNSCVGIQFQLYLQLRSAFKSEGSNPGPLLARLSYKLSIFDI